MSDPRSPAPSPPPAPPALAVWLLSRLLPDELREPFLGDLEESFHHELRRGRGPAAAGWWYWRETLRAPLTLSRAAGHPASSAPRGDGPMTSLLIDLHFAFRLLARRPAFTALVTLTLALGIGATTAIFSAVYPILFAPLPFPHPERLVMVWERDQKGTPDNFGFATYRDVVDANRSFDALAAMGHSEVTMTGRAEPERLEGQKVSSTFFRTLGVAPALGREFRATEDVPGAERVTILSHGLWRSRFGGDSSLVGRQIALDGIPYTVIGVMPASFENVLDPKAQLWTPLRYDLLLAWACRTCRHLRVVGRLKAGVSVTDAERELGVLSRRIVADHPKEYEGVGMLVPTLHEQVTGGVKPALLAVLGAVALVLLIACANVTNLLLARAAQREGEFSVRAALGAGHVRVIRQLLTESLVLAAIGGVLGIGVAWLGVQALVALSPPGLPRIGAIGVNGPVLVFAVLITTTVGLAFGVAPALHATRGDLYHGLMRTSRRLTGSRRVTRASLVVSEVALAMVLLVGSGLLLRSMTRLFAVSPGFDPSHLLTMEVVTGGPRFTSDTATHAYFQRVLEAAGAVPGVETAALTSQLPLTNDYDAYGVHSEARPRANTEQDPSAHRYAVSGRYLETMRIPVLRGRGLTDRDRGDGLAVLLINQAFARREWPGTDPIGQRVRLGDATQGPWRTIVGIVGDVKQVSLSADQPNAIYVPEEQWPWADFEMSLVVRTRGDPAALVPALRRAVWSVDRDQPIVRVSTMERLVTGSAAERRFTLVLFESFAAVALIMAAAGIYGVLAGTVVERRPEIGVRAALGATRANILMLVVRQGLGLTTIGIVLGLAGAAAMARIATSLLFGISPVDLFTYVGVTVLLVVVALAACWIPAWRAARLDPMATLRTD